MALKLECECGDRNILQAAREIRDMLNLRVITDEPGQRSGPDYVDGYQFIAVHAQYHSSAILSWAIRKILGVPSWWPSVRITDQRLDNLTVTMSGSGFNTLIWKLIENGKFYKERFTGIYHPYLNCKLNQDPEYLSCSGYVRIEPYNGGAAKLTLSASGATQVTTKILFRRKSMWSSFNYSESVAAQCKPIGF